MVGRGPWEPPLYLISVTLTAQAAQAKGFVSALSRRLEPVRLAAGVAAAAERAALEELAPSSCRPGRPGTPGDSLASAASTPSVSS